MRHTQMEEKYEVQICMVLLYCPLQKTLRYVEQVDFVRICVEKINFRKGKS